MIDYRAHFARVAKRPGMFGLDWRYRSLVAYILGFDDATGGSMLSGIDEWLAERYADGHTASIAWWGQIHRHCFPDQTSDKRITYTDLDQQQSAVAIAELVAVLDTFLAER
jgi:hypothetical protein